MAEPDPRNRLRDVAVDLFGRQGVRDTSTRQILTAAGMKNPSAITYHFGSKALLIEDIVKELYGGQTPVLQRQIELAEGPDPTPEAWTAIAVNSSADLIETERGCLLARIWWEYDGYVHPNVFEEYLASGNPITVRWLDGIATTFPALPPNVAVARNVTMLRTLEWMIARRAGRILTGKPYGSLRVNDQDSFRQLMLEVAVGIVTAPTILTGDDVSYGE